MGVSSWIVFLGTQALIGPELLAKPDYSKHHECRDTWDVKYPYLVEVRYTGEPYVDDVGQRNYHKNRHGSLLTQKAVLTRGHDLDGYPNRDEKVHTNFQDCMKGGSEKPCLYVNTRRPRNSKEDAEMCGSNIIVVKVYQHPQFFRTGYQQYYDLAFIWGNTKFPFAVLELEEEVPTEAGQTIFPALILPRTPLEMLYMLRRMFTMGHDSQLCEYPHYDKLTHDGYYGPYAVPSKAKVTMLDCPKDDWANIERNRKECYAGSICFKNSIHGGTWEGVHVTLPEEGQEDFPIYQTTNDYYRRACEQSMLYPNVYNNSFIVFLGEGPSFTQKASPDVKRRAAEDKLGAPIVCNGVALAMTSTWHGRGSGRRDVYIGTSLFRGWFWILQMRQQFQNSNWHRAKDDHPFLGKLYNFKKKALPKRNYRDRSVFEMSLNEAISPRPKSLAKKIHVEFTTLTILFIILQSSSC